MNPPGPLPHGLQTAHDQVRHEIARADTKASTLLSLVGAALAGVIALTGRAVPPVATVLLWLSAAPIAASVVLLLIAVRPRLNNTPVVGTWLYAATVGAATLLEAYQDGQQPSVGTAHDVCVLARIAHAKYVGIQRAVTLLLAGLAVLSAALVLSVVTR